jgi:protease I
MRTWMVLLLLWSPLAWAQSVTDDVAAIRATVADYTEGVKTGDESRLQRAFHPDAKLYYAGKDGSLAFFERDAYISGAVRKPFKDRTDAVLQVDVFGDAAVAKVSVRSPQSEFIDYISLLRLQGRWTIVSKVFHRAPRADASPSSTATAPAPTGPLAGRRVAILLTHGFNLPEMTETRRALLEAGARVELVAPAPGTVRADTGGGASEFAVDLPVAGARPGDYHALYLPGGTLSADKLRLSPESLAFVKSFVQEGKPVAAICHGLWLLADAGGVKGRKVTSYPSLRNDLRNAGATWVDAEVVVDGPLVTSRKPEDLPAFNREAVALFTRGGKKRP